VTAPPTPPLALEVAVAAAKDAGAIVRAAFRAPHDVTVKGRGNLVTETDFQSERFLHETFRREFPAHAIMSEETASDTPLAGWVWVIDPLDGTKNFASGLPYFCVNIALCYDGRPLVGVTYDPNQDECFAAELGKGAFVNGQPIHASAKDTVEQSVISVDIGYDNERGRSLLQMVNRLFPRMQGLRIQGSAALGLAYAACGRFDLFVHRYLFPWDIAAGILLVEEAGGIITDESGMPADATSQTALAGGKLVHQDFIEWQRQEQNGAAVNA
jgi:fructose-1,6-bisphosphatase/inositol monophosphatase family enzyme